MNWIFDLALRNIKRNRRRTVLAVISIALAVALTTFLNGFTSGVLQNMVKNITKNESGHIRIASSGFVKRSRFMPMDELVSNPEAVIQAIRSIPDAEKEIVAIAPRIVFGTLLSNGPNTVPAYGIAGDSGPAAGVLNMNRSIVKGRYLEKKGEIILGEKAASSLGLTVGDSIRIVTQGADYSLRLRRFTIVGLFSTGLVQMDKGFFQIPLEDATEFLRTGGAVQQILIFLKDYTHADQVSAQIKQSLAKAGIPIAGSGSEADGELSIQSWTEIGEYPRLIKLMEVIYFWIELVITFLGAFIISNIMMMVVLERKREIGILKALGLNRRETLRLFLAEGAVMGLIGSGAGALVGLLLCWVFSVYGIDFSSAVGSLTFPIDPVFYSVVNPLNVVALFIMGLFVSLVVSYLPSRRAARLDPVEAIKAVA
jgi:putative ABC transport system permease protein